MVLVFGPDKNLQAATRDDWDAAGRAGFEHTARGEPGIMDALETIFLARPRAASNAGPQKVFGRLYQWLAFAKGSKEPGDIKRIMRDFIFDHFAIATGRKVFCAGLPCRRLHTASSLAAEAGLNVRTLRNVLISKGLVPTDDEKMQATFDAEEGRKVAASIARLVHVISLPKALGCTRPQADQLFDEGLLTPIVDEFVEGHGHVRKAFDAAKIAGFLDDLRNATRGVDVIGDDLVTISKAVERAKISSGEIIHLILGRHLKTIVCKSCGKGVASIFVDSDEMKSVARDLLVGLSVLNAAGRLKMPCRSVLKLAAENSDVLPSEVVKPEVGRHGFFRFMEQDVESFRANFMTAVRVANFHGVEVKVISGRLKRAGVKPVLRYADIGLDLYRTSDIPEFARI